MTTTTNSAEVSGLTDERLAEIMAGLEGVTPGPWVYPEDETKAPDLAIFSEAKPKSATSEHGACIAHVMMADPVTGFLPKDQYRTNAAHIARCDPGTMRALLTELQSFRSNATAATAGVGEQHTSCATCGEDKPTPLRRDEMGGYVCLACIEERLDALPTLSHEPAPVREAVDDRDALGRRVRKAWVKWALTQPNPKPSWLVPYDELSEADKEADRQIGEALATPDEGLGVKVKPLEWRVPTDHPSDPDRDENVYCADGIGGKYAISKKQKVGPERLLWMADDPFVWVGYNSIPEAKAAAQADYETRILSTLEAGRA